MCGLTTNDEHAGSQPNLRPSVATAPPSRGLSRTFSPSNNGKETAISHGSGRNLLSRALSLKRLHENLRTQSLHGTRECHSGLLKRNSSNHSGSSNTFSRLPSDQTLGMAMTNSSDAGKPRSSRRLVTRAASDRRLNKLQSDRETTVTGLPRVSSVSKLFSKTASQKNLHEEPDATDALLAEMTSALRSPSYEQHGQGSSQSILVKTGSRRDLWGSTSSVRNLFGTTSNLKQTKVSFAKDDKNELLETCFFYDAPTEEEKKLYYDGRPESEIFTSAKKNAMCRLVAGSGVFKQAVDSAYEERKPTNRSYLKKCEDNSEMASLFRKAAETIASSDLRGLEAVYSQEMQFRRTKVIRKIVAAASNQKGGGPRRFAKTASEESDCFVVFAQTLALADAKQVGEYLSS